MTGVYEIRKGWAEETRVVGWDKKPRKPVQDLQQHTHLKTTTAPYAEA
jgi:hypothetical protein